MYYREQFGILLNVKVSETCGARSEDFLVPERLSTEVNERQPVCSIEHIIIYLTASTSPIVGEDNP